ncbi:MAG: TonB-dependent receptor [Rikenellaceae bacterium]
MRVFFTILTFCAFALKVSGQESEKFTTLTGEITSQQDGAPLEFATIVIDKNSKYATLSDSKGRFKLRVPSGERTLTVSYVGYTDYEQKVILDSKNVRLKISLAESAMEIDRIEVKGESQSTRINKTSYNVQSISLEEIKNTSASVSDALKRINGVKIRESGGLGSDTKISLNGFSGNHVKVFIDGILLDQTNSSFSLSNMPANFAERIDVYSGVVPIEFGTDAIGGVINVVTNKKSHSNRFSVDASYSYGSFNTHSSYLNIGKQFNSGLMLNLNLYQNYSDNNYWVTPSDVYLLDSETGAQNWVGAMKVQRYNDSYHNETGIITVGVTNKSWADLLSLKMNYSQYYNNIQTGTTEIVVYGDKYRKGYSYSPTLEYDKKGLFIKGLDVKGSVSFTQGYTTNYEGKNYQWDWLGESKYNAAFSGLDTQMENNSWAANLSLKYSYLDSHQFSVSHNFSNSKRTTRSRDSDTNLYGEWTYPQDNIKHITGVSYRYRPNKKLDATAFAKNYLQTNEGTVMSSDTYYKDTNTDTSVGYGTAASYFIIRGLQAKFSYEKSYRLPTATEIYGDGDLEQGTFDLNPETSHNFNLNLIYALELGKHNIILDGALIYRDTRDYIQRSTSSDQARNTSSASYENFGKVETKGYTIGLRYDYSKYFSLGGTFNNISPRNNEEGLTSSGGTTITYGLRLPNTPYMYANADAAGYFFNVFAKDDSITLTYDIFYQYEFPLYWETIGYKEDKMYVPTQLSHNVSVGYSFKGGTYNITLEAKNILDTALYDNYSLQKAGRAFYAKFRVNINKIK